MARSLRLLGATTVLFGTATLGGVCAPSAWACSCVPAGDEEYFGRADVVFIGLAIDRYGPDEDAEPGASDESMAWGFLVESVQKGDVGPGPTVEGGPATSTCSYWFEEGKRYQVFATSEGGQLSTDLCSGTRLLAEGAEPYLPQPAQTAPPTEQPAPTETPPAEETPDPTPQSTPAPTGTPQALDEASPAGMNAGLIGLLIAVVLATAGALFAIVRRRASGRGG